MKKLLGVGIAVIVIAFMGVYVWSEMHERSIRAEADQFVADAQSRKLIDVEFEVLPPPETPQDQPLFISGSEPALGNWDAAGVRLDRADDGKYRAQVQVTSGVEYAFKITRGTWGTVEKGPGGEELENRPLLCDQPQTVTVSVASWVDDGKAIPGRVTTSGDIRLHKKVHSNLLGNERTIVVYLPAEYEAQPEARYPVLYMHDGQNLFDESTSYAGIEWKLDEAAQRLIAEHAIRPIIIVGIYNTPERTEEFTPPPQGRADKYAQFVVGEVKPFIDRTYRTLPDRANTALAGSSMGGLVTLYMGREQNSTFGQVAVLTPFLRSGERTLLEMWNGDLSWLRGTRVWIDMGPSPKKYYPGDDPLSDARAFVQAMNSASLKPVADYRYVELSDGEHTEASWQTRAADVLVFLFGTEPAPTTAPVARNE